MRRRNVTEIAIALTTGLYIGVAKPARPNPAIAVPAACASILPACIVLGTVAIGGAVYWIYENSEGLWIAPIVDPENPEGWELSEEMSIPANSQAEADRTCLKIARRYNRRFIRADKARVQFPGGGDVYICRFARSTG